MPPLNDTSSPEKRNGGIGVGDAEEDEHSRRSYGHLLERAGLIRLKRRAVHLEQALIDLKGHLECLKEDYELLRADILTSASRQNHRRGRYGIPADMEYEVLKQRYAAVQAAFCQLEHNFQRSQGIWYDVNRHMLKLHRLYNYPVQD